MSISKYSDHIFLSLNHDKSSTSLSKHLEILLIFVFGLSMVLKIISFNIFFPDVIFSILSANSVIA